MSRPGNSGTRETHLNPVSLFYFHFRNSPRQMEPSSAQPWQSVKSGKKISSYFYYYYYHYIVNSCEGFKRKSSREDEQFGILKSRFHDLLLWEAKKLRDGYLFFVILKARESGQWVICPWFAQSSQVKKKWRTYFFVSVFQRLENWFSNNLSDD